MLYASQESRYPSIVVRDGDTITLSGKAGQATGVPMLPMRPRTTAALMLMAGHSLPQAPRLSDEKQFAEVDCTDGLVNLTEADEEGRVGGYSVPFLRRIINALDPEQRVPPARVRKLVPREEIGTGCACEGSAKSGPALARTEGDEDMLSLSDAAAWKAGYSIRESFVPDFIIRMEVLSFFTRLGDIIVGRNATLILDGDLMFALADNVLAYRGARVVQRSPYLVLNVGGTLRGGITRTFHDIVSDTVMLDKAILAADIPIKP